MHKTSADFLPAVLFEWTDDMIEKPCSFVIRPGDRLFPTIHNLVISASTLSIALSAALGGPMPDTPGSNIALGCGAKPLSVKIHASTVAFRMAFEGRPFNGLPIEIFGPEGTVLAGQANFTHHFEPISRAIFFPHFVEYFERYKDTIYKLYPGGRLKWPEPLGFCAVVRDAISHNGIRILNSQETVVFGSRSYSKTDNHDPFLARELGFGDLLLLMLEMTEHLDKGKCPII